MNTAKQVISAGMRELALQRWRNTSKRARKKHASKMGKASAKARARQARKSALSPVDKSV